MVRFGPAGNSEVFYSEGYKDSFQAPKWLSEMGLKAYEYSLTLGRYLSEETAKKLGEQAKLYDIEVSVHGPYFINFCNISDISRENNSKFLLNSLKNLKDIGGRRCIFHIGSQMKMTREEAMRNLKTSFLEFLDEFYQAGYDGFYLMPETMGKFSQIGTVEEILEIASWDKSIIPCFDFGHINSLTGGKMNSKQAFLDVFNRGIEKIGREKMQKCHIHFSKIKYGEKGEIAHLTFADDKYGPDFEPMLDAIFELGLEPIIICESKGTQAPDAVKMLEYFKKLS